MNQAVDITTLLVSLVTIGIPSIIAALKSGSGLKEIRRVKSMLNAHLTDPDAHNKARPIRSVRERGKEA